MTLSHCGCGHEQEHLPNVMAVICDEDARWQSENAALRWAFNGIMACVWTTPCVRKGNAVFMQCVMNVLPRCAARFQKRGTCCTRAQVKHFTAHSETRNICVHADMTLGICRMSRCNLWCKCQMTLRQHVALWCKLYDKVIRVWAAPRVQKQCRIISLRDEFAAEMCSTHAQTRHVLATVHNRNTSMQTLIGFRSHAPAVSNCVNASCLLLRQSPTVLLVFREKVLPFASRTCFLCNAMLVSAIPCCFLRVASAFRKASQNFDQYAVPCLQYNKKLRRRKQTCNIGRCQQILPEPQTLNLKP